VIEIRACYFAIIERRNPMKMSDVGPDPSAWSNARMTGVGLSIAGGVAGAFTSALVAAAANKTPGRVLSAQEAYDAEVNFLRLDNSLMQDRLQYSQRETREERTRNAELEAQVLELEYRARF
jgi:hypothetical protein